MKNYIDIPQDVLNGPTITQIARKLGIRTIRWFPRLCIWFEVVGIRTRQPSREQIGDVRTDQPAPPVTMLFLVFIALITQLPPPILPCHEQSESVNRSWDRALFFASRSFNDEIIRCPQLRMTRRRAETLASTRNQPGYKLFCRWCDIVGLPSATHTQTLQCHRIISVIEFRRTRTLSVNSRAFQR